MGSFLGEGTVVITATSAKAVTGRGKSEPWDEKQIDVLEGNRVCGGWRFEQTPPGWVGEAKVSVGMLDFQPKQGLFLDFGKHETFALEGTERQ